MAVVIAGLFLSQARKKRTAIVDTDFAGRTA
jgi:hypothetical protein